MKTLDEVIKALEICDETVTANCPDCPYDIDCENVPGEDLRADALHYLKVLQKMQKAKPLEKSDWSELYNQPLTWSELKSMEGKPVWVEEKPDNEWIGYWNVVKRLETFDDGSESILFISSEYYDEENYGIEWRAYRKERK